jgi:hypothetical protein
MHANKGTHPEVRRDSKQGTFLIIVGVGLARLDRVRCVSVGRVVRSPRGVQIILHMTKMPVRKVPLQCMRHSHSASKYTCNA